MLKNMQIIFFMGNKIFKRAFYIDILKKLHGINNTQIIYKKYAFRVFLFAHISFYVLHIKGKCIFHLT